jgi:hypothetical protein
MKIYNRRFSLYISAFIIFLFCPASVFVYGQTEPAKPAPTPQNQITADENIKLNIVQERITEKNFERSTDVALTDASRGNLRVEVGVGVRAESIDVILRGIFGNVRFRASLESLRQRIERPPPTQMQNSNAPPR